MKYELINVFLVDNSSPVILHLSCSYKKKIMNAPGFFLLFTYVLFAVFIFANPANLDCGELLFMSMMASGACTFFLAID